MSFVWVGYAKGRAVGMTRGGTIRHDPAGEGPARRVERQEDDQARIGWSCGVARSDLMRSGE